jgi:hypothetical protein
MKFATITMGWTLALICAFWLNSCGASQSSEKKELGPIIDEAGGVKIFCIYGVRYGTRDRFAAQYLVPLVGTDGWPLPCENPTPESCEKRLLACQVDCLADQSTLRELEECEGLNELIDRCIGGDGKGVKPKVEDSEEKKSLPLNPYGH